MITSVLVVLALSNAQSNSKQVWNTVVLIRLIQDQVTAGGMLLVRQPANGNGDDK